MKRSQLWMALGVAGILISLQTGSSAQTEAAPEPMTEQRILVGAELGGTGAMAPLDQFAENGAAFSPFVGYMYNDYLGVLGHLNLLAIPIKDRPHELDDDVAWALGGTVGPRIALPLGGFELWGTWQGGFMSGLSPHSPISTTSWTFSTGGGVNVGITDRLSFGAFGRYTRLYQQAHYQSDSKYASGGITVTYRLDMPTWETVSEPGPPPPK